MGSLKDLLAKIPFTLLAFAYIASLGWDYYTFKNDAQSPLQTKQNELQAAQDDVAKLKRRVAETQEFVKTLDLKRLELRKLAQDLEESKATLTDNLDTPAFMKAVVTEAQRSGLTVTSISPKDLTKKDFYAQQAFEIKYRGVYPQLISFLDRIANMQRIARVDNFSMHPISPSTSKFVTIEGVMEMKAYYYSDNSKNGATKPLIGAPGVPAMPGMPGAPGMAAPKAGA